MSDSKIRYGVVGLGRAGWHIHVAGIRPRTDSVVAAVADPLAERRDEAVKELGCEAYTSLDEMLKNAKLDVVVIATPSSTHGPDSIKAMRAGFDVLVEKPMAMSVAEADQMIAVMKETGKRLFIHQNYRFRTEVTHLQQVIASGKIGRLYHIRSYSSGFARRNDWQTLQKNGGGVLNNTCPHFLDILMTLVGSPIVKVMGDLQQIASAGDVEDHVKAFLRAANGATIDMEISSAQKLEGTLPKWIVCGSTGTLTSDGKTSTIHWFDPKQAAKLEVIEGAATDRKYGNSDQLPWQTETVDAKGPDIGNYYDNIKAVLRDGADMVVKPEQVREVMRVIAEIRAGTKFPG